MISARSSGSFDNLEAFLKRVKKPNLRSRLERFGQEGVNALASATPRDSGLAASSWSYEIKETSKGFTIAWLNNDVEGGFPVAIMLQYGYSTGTGGYVAGEDYINPVMRPIFDRIADDIWREVTRA